MHFYSPRRAQGCRCRAKYIDDEGTLPTQSSHNNSRFCRFNLRRFDADAQKMFTMPALGIAFAFSPLRREHARYFSHFFIGHVRGFERPGIDR